MKTVRSVDDGRRLSDELVWEADGHLTEVAIVALADAQDILPDEAPVHLAGCEQCALRVGEAALVSLGVQHALATSKKHATRAVASRQPGPGARGRDSGRDRAVRPLPVPAVVIALALAAAGVMPLLFDLRRTLPHTLASVVHMAPAVLRGATAAARGADSSQALVASSVSLLVAIVALLIVARLTRAHASSVTGSKEGAVS